MPAKPIGLRDWRRRSGLAAGALGQALGAGAIARPRRLVLVHGCTSTSAAPAAGAAVRPSATVSPPARPERTSTRPSAATSPSVTTRDWARPSLVADDDQRQAAALDQRLARDAHGVALARPGRKARPAAPAAISAPGASGRSIFTV